MSTFLVESFSVRGRLNRTLRYAFGDRIPLVPIAGRREISSSFRIFEENVAAVNTMRALQRSKTPVDINVTFGDAAGYTAVFGLNKVVLSSEQLDDSGPEYIVSLQDSMASMTDAATQDELTLTLT